MSDTHVFEVRGMTCGGCAKKVRTALQGDLGDEAEIKVDHANGRVSISGPKDVSGTAVQATVERLGYTFAGAAQ